MNALIPWFETPAKLALVKKTVAKDCDVNSKGEDLMLGEFSSFIHICSMLHLDPLRRQIYAFVFHKDDPKRRQMVPVVAIGGYRSIATRAGNYRPGESELVIARDLIDADANPLGIEHAKATVYQYMHGEWHPIVERAYWEEFAPIIDAPAGGYEWEDTGEVWADSGKPKKRKVAVGEVGRKLDPKKDAWRRMPRVMLEKCAEAKAIRRGWPDDVAGTYVEGELDKAQVLDLTATEVVNEYEAERKLALVGGLNALTVTWLEGGKLDRVAEGEFCDRVMAWANTADRCALELRAWWANNTPARSEYKARHGGEYLIFQQVFETRLAKLTEAEAA